MLQQQDKDEIISFLRAHMQKIKEIANQNSKWYENNDGAWCSQTGPCLEFTNIYNIAEKALNETVW